MRIKMLEGRGTQIGVQIPPGVRDRVFNGIFRWLMKTEGVVYAHSFIFTTSLNHKVNQNHRISSQQIYIFFFLLIS